MPNNEQTSLQKAAHKYAIKHERQIESPSAATVRGILHDAFIEGALWAVDNPVLTSDMQRKKVEESVAVSGG